MILFRLGNFVYFDVTLISRAGGGRLDQLKVTIREPSVPHGNLILIAGTMRA